MAQHPRNIYYPHGILPYTMSEYFYNSDGFTYYPPDVGAGGYGSAGFGAATMSSADLAGKAMEQIKLAKMRSSLSAYNAVTHPNSFFMAPNDTRNAYYKTAYWYAVGSRVMQGKDNAVKAAELLALAEQSYKEGLKVFWASESGAQIAAIVGVAAKNLNAAGALNTAAVLARTGTGQKINLRREVEQDQQVLANTAAQTAADAAAVARKLKEGLGLSEKDEMKSSTKWILVAGGFIVALSALAYFTKPFGEAAKIAAERLGKKDEDE